VIYQLLNVHGDDAESFLQGQLTQDVGNLRPEITLPAAWCNPKGRVVTTMNMIRSADGIGLLLPAGIATTVVQRISIYKLRAAVELELEADWNCVAVQSETGLERLREIGLLPETTYRSYRNSGRLGSICIHTEPLVVEVFGPDKAILDLGIGQIIDDAAWRSALIRAGNVLIDDGNSEKYTPHMLSLDLAGAVSFDKGCYTGQEVVARTEHRGRSRRRLARFTCEFADNASGDELFDDDSPVGVVVNASGHDVLAVVPVDAHAKVLSLNGRAARPVALPWQEQDAS
jgi:folate-binding protein YgfZ